jgi:hypothetical protein
MSREAMQLALEVLEKVITAFGSGLTLQQNAITALRKALETEQEPVAWISEGGDVSRSKRYMDEMGFKCNPLYTAPPKQWVGLTDEEIYDCEEEVGMPQYEISSADLYAFASVIEAKLREKNT